MGNKIEVLLPHIIALEDFFDSRPSDVAELGRRDRLIQYVTIALSCAVLTYFQQAQGHRGTTVGEPGTAAARRPRQR